MGDFDELVGATIVGVDEGYSLWRFRMADGRVLSVYFEVGDSEVDADFNISIEKPDGSPPPPLPIGPATVDWFRAEVERLQRDA